MNLSDECQDIQTPSIGTRKSRNTDFVFSNSCNNDGVTGITIGIQAPNDAIIILSPSKNPADDIAGEEGIPKIGKTFDKLKQCG